MRLKCGSVGAVGKGQIPQADVCAGTLACDKECGLDKMG